ncbi:Uncharacterised protein [Klebsiella pneumoniae]|nr:Uncharacterised protein [Klebsiella pneumoniae]
MNVGGTLQPTGRRMVSQKTVEGIIPSLVGPGMNLFNKGAVISGFYLFEGTGIPGKILSTAIQKRSLPWPGGLIPPGFSLV